MYSTETRTFPKGIKEIRVFDDNISLRFTSRDRTGYITLNNATGKFDIIPGIGVDAPVTSVNTMTGDVVITAADLNAALIGHTHLKADITDFIHTHTKADISDFGHTHTKSQITDLGNILPEAPLDGKQYARKNANWEEVVSTASSTGTNLSSTRTSSSVVILSDTGTDASIPSATTSLAGVMTSTDKLKVDSAVQNINPVDGGMSLVHVRTGDTCNIKSLQAGANITLTDYAGVVTISSTGTTSSDVLTSDVNIQVNSITDLITGLNAVPNNLNNFKITLNFAANTTIIYNNDYDFSRFSNGSIVFNGVVSIGDFETVRTSVLAISRMSINNFNNVNIIFLNMYIRMVGSTIDCMSIIGANSMYISGCVIRLETGNGSTRNVINSFYTGMIEIDNSVFRFSSVTFTESSIIKLNRNNPLKGNFITACRISRSSFPSGTSTRFTYAFNAPSNADSCTYGMIDYSSDITAVATNVKIGKLFSLV